MTKFVRPGSRNKRPAPSGRSAAVRRSAGSVIEELECRQLMTRLVGIDVSSYQGTITWSTVKNSKQFAFIRATTGQNTVDSKFTANATGAINNGMYAGFYHYAYYSEPGHTAISEADHFFDVIKNYLVADGKHLMPVLDVEDGTTVAVGGTLDAWCDAWCQRVQSRALNELGLVVTPMVYTSASHAGSYFSSGVMPQNYPLWVAQWPATLPNTQTAQPSGVGDWQSSTSPFSYSSWSFWQYADDGAVAGISGNVDLDVFQGDANAIKTYVIGSAGRWAAGTRVQANSSSPLLKAWSTPAANGTYVTVPNGTKGTIVLNPTYNTTHDYGGSFWRWYIQFDNGMSGWVAEYQSVQPASPNAAIDWLTTVTPSAPTTPAPATSTTAYVTSLPTDFAWTAGANATSYDVYLDGVKKTTVTSPSWAHPAIADGAHTWRVDAINGELKTTGTTWNFLLDSIAPTATYGGQSPAQGAGTMTFTVTYADAASGILASSLGAGDVVVTGPNGFSQVAAFVSVDTNADGTPRTATYSIAAPGGTWDIDDNGTYTVTQAASHVRDVAGNFRAAGTIGTFALGLPPAYAVGSTLYVNYPDPGTITINRNGGNIVVSQAGNTYTFAAASVAAIAVTTTDGNDTISLFGNIPAPISLAGAGGANAITFNPGANATLASDAPGYSILIGSGAVLSVTVPLHLASLTIGGTVLLPAGGTATLALGNLSIDNSGTLDLADNALVWNYDGASPIDALRTFLYKGRNGGTWDGSGGISSSAANADPTHTAAFGYLEAADLGVTSFAGADADATTLVVRYTDAGDVSLDGRLDADDYALTDRGFARNSANPHWLNGDFDYDGLLTAGDYLLLDTSALLLNGDGSTPSPELLAAREATFGPAYVSALLAPETPAPVTATAPAEPTTTFSDAPITDTATADSDPAPVAAAPTAVVTGPTKAKRNKPAPFKFAVSGAPTGRFTYRVDWNGDGVVDQTLSGSAAINLTHKFARPGAHSITLWITDDTTGLTSDPASFSFRVL